MNENSHTPPPDDEAPPVAPKALRLRRSPALKNEASATPGPVADTSVAVAPDAENAEPAPRRRRRKLEVAPAHEAPDGVALAPSALHAVSAGPADVDSVAPAPESYRAPEQLWAGAGSVATGERPQADLLRRSPPEGDEQSGKAEFAQEVNAPTAAPGQGRDDEDGPRGRRRNRRDRKRRDRGDAIGESGPDGAPGAELDAAPRIQAAVAQAGELFAQVLSGAFDTDEAPEGELPGSADGPVVADADPVAPGEIEAHKRILAAEPEAPKLHKMLAQAGVGSRRDMEDMILDGRITVNGEPAHVGQRIAAGDQIKVNGKIVKVRITPPPARLIAYHKPVGEIVTHDDPQNRPTVYRRLPRLAQGKWQSVGRLDINTEGLLLFTNSGELAHQLMHPRFGVEREYAVRVLGTLEPEAKAQLIAGVEVEGQMANFRSIEDGGGEGVNRWYRVVIAEGRNREVRKLFDTVGLTVNRLIRIRYGSVVLPHGLKRGVWVDLDENEMRAVRRLAGGERAVRQEPAAGRGPERGGHPPRPRNDRGGGHAERSRDPRDSPRDHPRDPQRDPQREPQRGRPAPQHAPQAQPEREAGLERGPDTDFDADHDFDPRNIPNPLEQTFDKRFVQNPRSPAGGRGFGRGGGGFGAGGSAPPPASPRRGPGPKEPDPLQTSLGYIGADAFHRKSKGGPRGGGGGGGFGGGGGSGGGRRGR